MTHKIGMKKDRRPQDSPSPIETLRLERTQLSQAEFAVLCGIPLRTYQRWISGETEAKPTPRQWKAMIRILKIESLEEIPDDFGPVDLTDDWD
ncbi:MAG: helix-turn-helix domain-containing protein [Lyngbya sp.]|nr:helix-turn-helix domain-containing protein [Lyngbya sp.]